MSLSDFYKSSSLPDRDKALPDRASVIEPKAKHVVLGTPLIGPFPDSLETAVFGLGCFWGAERLYWQLEGVYSTAVGYGGGVTANPGYEDVCSGRTGHTEIVLVVFDPDKISYQQLLKVFWESHNPTQGMRQGNDRGTQYRSAVYCSTDAQLNAAKNSMDQCNEALREKGFPPITTEVKPLDHFYYAEDYHQQYLAKNPNGYCGLAGTGLCYQPEEN